ncbi:MAG: CGNR zinc finger domain-containing protein [Cognatishimia sp.]
MNSVSNRPEPMFIGESPALDFLNSIASPKGKVIDWLDTETGLLDWLVKSGLCTSEELEVFKSEPRTIEQTKALHDIQEFRDAFRKFIEAMAGGDVLQPTDPFITRINAILLRGTLTMQLEPSQDGTTRSGSLTTKYQIVQPQDFLPRIAAACAKFICEANFAYVRNCEGPTCTLYFYDVSKNRKRRWCSMSVCGNRAKAAAHRKASAAALEM